MAAVPSIGRAQHVEGAPAPEADLTRSLYEQYAGQIFRYCLHQLGSREEAEDAVQSTFLNAFRGIKRGVVPEAESAWLFKIAHNVCLSRRRSSWRRGRIESPADFDVVEELAPAPSRRADELIGLQDVLEEMPEQQRRAILLREWQGLSYREIADELELSQAAVETLIFRARRSLAQGLEQPAAVRRKRSRFGAGALGNLLSSAQSFLLGGGAAVKVAATVAVVSAGTVVATAPVQHRHAPAPVRHAPVAAVHERAQAPAAQLPSVQRTPAPQVSHRVAPQHAVARHVAAPHAPAPAAASHPQPAAPQPTELSAPPVQAGDPPAATGKGAEDTPPGQAKQSGDEPSGHAASPSHGRADAPGQVKQDAAEQPGPPPVELPSVDTPAADPPSTETATSTQQPVAAGSPGHGADAPGQAKDR